MADMNPKRVNAITIRFDDSEWHDAANGAAACDRSLSDFIHQDGPLATTLREIAAMVDELQALNLIQTARIKLLIDLFDGGDLVGMADAIEGTQDAPWLREVCHV